MKVLIGSPQQKVLVQAQGRATRVLVGGQGVKGPPGPGLAVKGKVATVGDLPGAPAIGDAWKVDADGHIYVWDGAAWDDLGKLQGETGPQGLAYETYDASIYKSDGITVGGYYLDRRASMANVQDTIYAEIIDGDAGTEIDMYLEVAGAAAYGPFTVAVGTPVSLSALGINVAADDEVNVVITAIIGGAVRDLYFKSHGAAA